jgi:hypothetical protein
LYKLIYSGSQSGLCGGGVQEENKIQSTGTLAWLLSIKGFVLPRMPNKLG